MYIFFSISYYFLIVVFCKKSKLDEINNNLKYCLDIIFYIYFIILNSYKYLNVSFNIGIYKLNIKNLISIMFNNASYFNLTHNDKNILKCYSYDL